MAKLKSGEISPEKMTAMTSKERNVYFASFLGQMNADKVNALLETKLLLKNQQRGLVTWAKQLTGIKPTARRDLVTRINNMTDVLKPEDAEKFYADLARQRLGVGVTVEEAGKIAGMAKEVETRLAKIPESSPIGSKERMDYGVSLVALKEYVKGLKSEAQKIPTGQLLRSPWQILKKLSGGLKSVKASLDASFSLRQGLPTLITKPQIWAKSFFKSFDAWSKELRGIDGVAPVKADVFSRPNAINGNYSKLKLDIGLDTEEAFPEAWPTKIPLLGRLYKASMSAYNGALMRMRADLADRFIDDATKSGVTSLEDSGLGLLVNSMTGRGRVHMTKPQADTVNALIFSIRYFKSQLDVMSAGLTDRRMWGARGQKIAAQNLLRIIGTMGGLLATAKALDPDSVEEDPRSTRFGKIYVRIGDKRVGVDITGGMRSLVILASRIVPTMHKGEWGLWYKNSKGNYYNMWNNQYGKPTPDDFIVRFMEGKASPAARTILNIWKQKQWDGKKPTFKKEVFDLLSPISITNATETMKTAEGEDLLLRMIISGLNLMGAGTSTESTPARAARKNK